MADEEPGILTDRTWLAGGFGAAWDALRERLMTLPRPVFPLEGRDALALGARPGPAVGAALRDVRDVWLDPGCTMDRGQLTAQLRAALIKAAALPRAP
jgi:poly(A) polymerase